MSEPSSLQAILNAALPRYAQQHPLSAQQRKICRAIQQCRTPALGGLALACERCGGAQVRYHACRDRHCPRCQHRQREQWCARQRAAVLPVTYYHLVFTLPHALNAWAQLHPEVLYGLLFRSAWATLKDFGADPKRLGGELGATLVLHTWGQNLSQHLHLHGLIPGGALGAGGEWIGVRGHYLFPVRALSRVFRAKMVAALRAAQGRGEFKRITRPGEFEACLGLLMSKDWVVYAKPCLNHTDTVIDYLGRYSHRIALTDTRLQGREDGQVQLRYKDYRDGQTKSLALAPEELIRRFLLHVLPKGLVRIRHYGLLANRGRVDKLARARAALASMGDTEPVTVACEAKPSAAGFDGYPCPLCKQGRLRVIGEVERMRADSG